MFFWEKINLAPFLYAKIHHDYGGPIATLSARESTRLGEKMYEAFATLHESTGYQKEINHLYGNTHGSGSSLYRAEAIYRAISEALERWAWNEAYQNPEQKIALCYDLDPSTTGFAAFPGLVARSARATAYFEATERWSLSAWWEGKLDHQTLVSVPWEKVQGIEIVSPIKKVSVVVLWQESADFRAYGFAAAANSKKAMRKAAVELGRNIHVLEYQRSVQESALGAPANRNERRLLYFAGAEGKSLFDQRLKKSCSPLLVAPPLVVDRSVPGPWNKYAQVWRCLFDPRALYDNGGDNYFHF